MAKTKTVMLAADFDALIESAHLDAGATGIKALRLHLVGGKSQSEAADAYGISRQAVHKALGKLPRKRCPTCKQWLPVTARKRANRA